MRIPSFSVQLNPSRYMLAYLIIVHLLLLIALFSVSLSAVAQLFACLLVLLHAVFSRWRYLNLRHGGWVQRISYRDQCWALSGEGLQARVWLKRATVWRWLIVLNFYTQQGGRSYSVILWPDSADREVLRRLRSCLRHMPVYGRGSED